MCYKTALEKKADELALKSPLRLKYPEEYTPYYHNDAFLNPTLYIIPQDDKEFVFPSIWGLAPNFVIHSDKLEPSDYIKNIKHIMREERKCMINDLTRIVLKMNAA